MYLHKLYASWSVMHALHGTARQLKAVRPARSSGM